MSQEKVVLLGQSIDELIALFRSESPLSAQIKEYFHDFLLLDVEREATTALNIDWHPGVCSPSTNSYITNFYFKTL